MPEDFYEMRISEDMFTTGFLNYWQHFAPYTSMLDEMDLFAMYCAMSV